MHRVPSSLALTLCLTVASCSDATPDACVVAAPDALRVCVAAYGEAIAGCYTATGAPCAADEVALEAPLADLRGAVARSCEAGDFGALDSNAVAERLASACASEASSLAWRVYGGPQGAAHARHDEDVRACLVTAHATARAFLDDTLSAMNDCLADETCAAADVTSAREARAAAAAAEVDATCPFLVRRISLDPATYIDRVAHQADCLTATGHPNTAGLALHCGPGNADFDAPRGEWARVVVDGDKWGTLCGDGSDYSFWVQLAPAGARLDRVFIGLQGGGVCAFEEDCTARVEAAPGLFTAADDEPIGSGIGSDDLAENPFADWTRIYLPYCNQDVFAGGGVTETLGDLELPRYGSVNLRAAIQMVRDVIWREMDAAGGDGFRPDEVIALFGGWSAGAYGTIYNYHWLLDDLQWPRTIAFPDAGGALDNGGAIGVRALGAVKIPAWGMGPNLPPYCFTGDCAVGPVLYEALSPRLLQVPEQQLLVLSNPRDTTQQGDAFFDDEAEWINALRSSYCETRDLPGVHYFYTSVSDEPLHVVSLRPELWTSEVDGETMRDWFVRAVEQPGTLTSRVEEADFVTDVPGVRPYPCPVAP